MNNEWLKILVFMIIGLVLGYILGSMGDEHEEVKEIEIRTIVDDAGNTSEEAFEWTNEDGDKVISIKDGEVEVNGSFSIGDGEAEIHSVIKGIEDSEFEGDSVFNIGGAEVQIRKDGEEMQVEVKMKKEKED